jgi:hypothetical protein
MMLVFLARHFLVRLRISCHQQSPALTIYQFRMLLSFVLPMPIFGAKIALDQAGYYQQQNFAAYRSLSMLFSI